jgi:hypothetical protein
MSKFNFTGLLAVAKALYSATTKDNTKVAMVSDKVKEDTTIQFKNGSYIKVVSSKESARGNRAKLYPKPTIDFMPDWCLDKEILDEVLAPFCVEKENNNLDGQLLYVTSNKKKEKKIMKLRETIELMTSENYHDRFKAEYYQLVIRYKRLVKRMQMWDDGTLEFEPNCPRGTYNLQMKFMADYIAVLESRAAIEGIELEDIEVESH